MISWRFLKELVCLCLGHDYSPITVTLGKVIQHEVEARKCSRCGRIIVPMGEGSAMLGEDAA